MKEELDCKIVEFCFENAAKRQQVVCKLPICFLRWADQIFANLAIKIINIMSRFKTKRTN